MYNVYLDQQLIHDLDSDDNVLVSPTLNLELNKAGTFEFTMEPTHPFYDKLERFKSIIQVLQDGEEIFKGRIIEVSDDMYKQRSVYCESELAYLNDTIQRPYEFHLAANAVVEYLNIVIGSHNSQVDESRQFELGEITIKDPNDYIYCYTNYNPTMDEIKEDLVDDLGGYIRVRNVYANNDPLGTLQHRYLDYIGLEEYGRTSEQYIEFGENLLDFVSDINQSDLCTGIIPLGATLEESEYSAIEERVTIESVNKNSDYIYIPEAVEKYGLILKVVTWDDITLPENLLSTAENYLSEYDYENMVITATAVDLSILGATTQTLSTREVLAAYDTVTYKLTASNPISEIVSYEVEDRDDTGYARITKISYSGNTVSVTVDNSSRTEDLNITVTVVVRTGVSVEAWRLGDMIFVESTPHDVHKRFPLAQMSIPLDQPENTSVTLGTYTDQSLSAKTNKTESGLRNFEDFSTGNIIASAVAQATRLIDMKTNGYVTLHMDEDRGCVDELLIMDTPSTDTATRVWRWNLNGLGYSGSGYDTEHGAAYETAITMDGHILGTLIIANGMILADDKDVEFAKFDDTGMKIYAQSGRDDLMLMTIGRSGMELYDDTGKDILATFTSTGVKVYNGGVLSSSLFGNGMTFYNESGEQVILRLFQQGLMVNDDDGNTLVTLTPYGETFYYNGDNVGNIGTGYWTGYPNNRGLGFHLENSASYMTFGWRETSSASEYKAMIAYHTSNSSEAQGVHIGDTLFLRGYALYFGSRASGPYMTNGSNGALFTGDDFYFQNCTLWYGSNSNTCYEVLTTNSQATVTLKNGNNGSADLTYYVTGTWTLDLADLFSNYAMSSDLSNYALKSDIPDVSQFITSSALNGYATQSWVQDQLKGTTSTNGYVTKSDQGNIVLSNSNNSGRASGVFSFANGMSLDLSPLFGGDITCDNVYACENMSTRDTVMGVYVGGPVASSFSMGLIWANDVDTGTYGGLGFFYADHVYDATPSARNLFCYVDVTYYQGCYFGYNPDSAWYAEATTWLQGQSIHIGNPNGDDNIHIGYHTNATINIGLNDTCTVAINGIVRYGSDRRLKTDIQLLSKPMLDDISPVSFKWKEGSERTHFGYIAQDVQKVIPELVSEGEDGMLGIAYTELIPLLHMEIKALKEEIAQLKKGAA